MQTSRPRTAPPPVIKSSREPNTARVQLNDDKVLGHIYKKRLDLSRSTDQFQTRSFKTHNSSWTPLVHRPSNERIFQERKDLVSNWFDLWSDLQRKKFLDQIFRQCARPQLLFIQNWFDSRVPLRHLDFTRVLPRYLVLYILSFLDPRSLCHASKVSWNWHFMSDQDDVWRPKCQRFGWYLPYAPADNEYGAWKKHYVSCFTTLDVEVVDKKPSGLYGTKGEGLDLNKKTRTRRKLTPGAGTDIITLRGPWKGPDKAPNDLSRADRALRLDCNPNEPIIHKSLTAHHNRWGIVKANSSTTPYGLKQSARQKTHGALQFNDVNFADSHLLSECLEFENSTERRMMQLTHMHHAPPPPKKPISTSSMNMSGGVYQSMNGNAVGHDTQNFPMQEHPRVVFISSRVPAADIIVDAVNFGVIPVVYEYEGATLHSLISKLEQSLKNRTARSIGMLTHNSVPGELLLVHEATVTYNTLEIAEFIQFFESMATCVLPESEGGHIDLFSPLASCEDGQKMLNELSVMTGVNFTSPTGIIGDYNHVNSDWSSTPENITPPLLYFCECKLNVWSNTADQAHEACQVTKTLMEKYFEHKHRDLVAQLTGQVVFDALGQVDIVGLNEVTETLVDALIAMAKQQNVKPFEFLGNYLLSKSGTTAQSTQQFYPETTNPLGPSHTLSAQLQLTEQFEDSLPNSEATVMSDRSGKQFGATKNLKDIDNEARKHGQHSDLESSVVEDIEEQLHDLQSEKDYQSAFKPIYNPGTTTESGTPRAEMQTRRLTGRAVASNTEKRPVIAQEIYTSELAYMRTLEIIHTQFYTPLMSALNSNRAVLSAQNIKIIFNDALVLLEMSKLMVDELKVRIANWNAKECMGDVFLKFCGKLKAYTNYLNNYQVMLATLDRSTEQMPTFRAFLKRHQRQPETKMLTLAELLLAPTRRINEMVNLLTWFRSYTPDGHTDRNDLMLAINQLYKMDALWEEARKRSEEDKELVGIQQKVLNCPLLLEANRFFLLQLDVSHLQAAPGSEAVLPALKVYQHIEMIGLYLFNDSLLVTRRTTRHTPYTRAVLYNYRFETCCSLNRLRIEDIPDTKFVKNAFRVYTPSRSWICAADSFNDKFNWVSLLENTVRGALKIQ